MKNQNVGPRKFSMTSVGGKTYKTSRRKLDRMARSHGYRDAKAMYMAMIAQQVRNQMMDPAQFGSLVPVKQAA